MSLAAIDVEITPSPQDSGSHLILQHQKLMLDHFGHKHHAVLPEDVIQHLLLGVRILVPFLVFVSLTTFLPIHCYQIFPFVLSFQSSRTLELALHLESKVIALKQDAVRLMNIALAGTACGQLLSVMEFAFGYPESQESKDRAQQLEELERKFESDNDSPADEDAITKEQDVQDAAAQFPDTTEPKAKRRHFGQCQDTLKDLTPLGKAAPLLPSTTVKLSKTGVSRHQYTSREESKGQSIYRCKLLKPDSTEDCTYYAAQLAAMCNHIHRKHLGICIKCRLCNRKSFSSTTMSMPLHSAHPNSQNDWFEPVPALEGDVTEVTDVLLAENLQEIEGVKMEQEELE